jgi:signal transduction histidine kinase
MSQQSTIDATAGLSTARIRGAALYPPVRWTLEAVFSIAFVIGVYEALVAGEIHIWPNAPDRWILPVWVLAASLSGLGLGPVRRLARAALHRVWPSAADDPYAALARTVAGARRTAPGEDALARLAQIAVECTGAASATVVRAPADDEAEREAEHEVEGETPSSPLSPPPPSADAFPIRADGRVLGDLVLQASAKRPLTDADRRLAASLADAAGSVLRNAELTEQLDAQLQNRRVQAAELDRSRRRLVAARDEARELVGRRIQAGVGETLAWCAQRAAGLRDEEVGAWKPGLAELTGRIDASVREFRQIVHGIYPATLTDHGLAAALGNLVDELPGDATHSVPDLPRFAPRLEAGAYFCLAALLEPFASATDAEPDAEAGRALRVEVGLTDSELIITLAGTGTGDTADDVAGREIEWDRGTLDAVRDRVAALDGELVLAGGRGSLAELRLPKEGDR